MPIKKENKHLYPINWKNIRQKILERDNHSCKFCGIKNYSMIERIWKNGEKRMTKIILTIAHLDQNPRNNLSENLAALCQKCHLSYDRNWRVKNALTNGKD
jgi:5-methylcytosine-specific restriction endonuclease McrA